MTRATVQFGQHASKCAGWLRAAALLVALLAMTGCTSKPRYGDADLPNFQRVTPALYRGGQPTPAGFARLQQMGVKTVINVRGGNIDQEILRDHALDLNIHQRPMSPWSPSDEDVIWFLRLATDSSLAPMFLHCQHGADRSGYLIAMYRVVVEGWDRERAIEEMTADGMGFHDIYQGLISYAREADVERLRAAVGLPSSTARAE